MLVSLLLSGCASYEHYRPRPLSTAAIEQRLESMTERVEAIQPCAAHATLFMDFDGVLLADGVTPDEAAYVAVISNPGLRTIRDQRGIAQSQVIQAGILPNPQFAFGSVKPSFGNTAGAVSGDAESLTWDMSQLNPRGSRIRSAVLSVDSVNLDIARQEWLVAQQARQAVYDLVALRKQIDTLQAAKDQLDKNLKLVEKAEQEGNLTLVELSAAKSASALLQTTILASVQLERQQRMLLPRVLGLPSGTPIELSPGIELPIEGSPPTEKDLYPMLDSRFDVLALRRAYESQDQAYLAAIQAQVPTTVVGVTRARDTGALGTWGAGLAVDIPVFNRNQGNVALQRSTRERMYDQYVQLMFEARSDVSIALTRLRVIEEQIDAQQVSVANLTELVTTYKKVVDEGSGNVLLYYQTFNDLAQRRFELVQLQRDFVDAWIALENAVGERVSLMRTEPAQPTTTPLEEALPLNALGQAPMEEISASSNPQQ